MHKGNPHCHKYELCTHNIQLSAAADGDHSSRLRLSSTVTVLRLVVFPCSLVRCIYQIYSVLCTVWRKSQIDVTSACHITDYTQIPVSLFPPHITVVWYSFIAVSTSHSRHEQCHFIISIFYNRRVCKDTASHVEWWEWYEHDEKCDYLEPCFSVQLYMRRRGLCRWEVSCRDGSALEWSSSHSACRPAPCLHAAERRLWTRLFTSLLAAWSI